MVQAGALNKDLEFVTHKNQTNRKSACSLTQPYLPSSKPNTADQNLSAAPNSLQTAYFEKEKVSIIDVVLDN